MNIKSLFVSAVLLTCVPFTASQAYVAGQTLTRDAEGVVHPVEEVTNFWYNCRIDKRGIDTMLSKGIYGFQYVALKSNKTSSTGVTELGIEYPDELDKDWTVIFYMAESTMYDRSVFAINNKDGTATVFEPGQAPY